jgi:hypothetical protein
MSRLLLLSFLFLLTTQPLHAQHPEGQPPLWLFGNGAGLDFSAGTPQPLAGSAMNTVEGSAVACDPATGRLLFYTDGERVWDANHRKMPNGRDLGGSQNSSQSALVVRRPGQDSLWYLFTTDFQGGDQGLRLSVVSMKRRGGLGDIIRKNELVFAPVTEKLTAVRHANGHDVWIIAHRWQSPQYLALLLTADGIQQPPVLSTAGTAHAGPGRQAIGYLRASPDGRHLAAALWKDANKFEVLDFDPANGQLFGRIALEPYPEAYGVEFSADGSKLYGTSRDDVSGAVVWQFDLRPGPGSDATQYYVVVGRSKSKKIGALLRAPDGKIYLARDGAKLLGVIANPDKPGAACGFTDDGLPLGEGRSRLGLPNQW